MHLVWWTVSTWSMVHGKRCTCCTVLENHTILKMNTHAIGRGHGGCDISLSAQMGNCHWHAKKGYGSNARRRIAPPDLDLTINCILYYYYVWCEHYRRGGVCVESFARQVECVSALICKGTKRRTAHRTPIVLQRVSCSALLLLL